MGEFSFTPEVQAALEAAGVTLRQPFGIYPIMSRVAFEPPVAITAELAFYRPLEIGAFSHLNGGFIQNATIGRYCSFARDVQIGHGYHPHSWLSVSPLQYGPGYRGFSDIAARLGAKSADIATMPFSYEKPTTIGNDVWLGNHVFVMDGITIGDGAIVGAGSVVTKDVEPYTIVAGNPARPIRARFPSGLVERMLGLGWWRFALADLSPIDFSNPSAALDRLERLLGDGAIFPYAPRPIELERT